MNRTSKLIVFKCPYNRPCGNYQCRNVTKENMWFVGVKENYGDCHIYCNDCMIHMLANLPEELRPTDEAIMEAVRAEVMKEIGSQIEVVNAELLTKDEEIAALKEFIIQITEGTNADDKKIESEDELTETGETVSQSTEDAPAEEPIDLNDIEDPSFRCLDCGKEDFASQRALDSHRGKMHKAQV